ncbi:hypothetical protein HK100_010542, partial [Physocladia obscura]
MFPYFVSTLVCSVKWTSGTRVLTATESSYEKLKSPRTILRNKLSPAMIQLEASRFPEIDV